MELALLCSLAASWAWVWKSGLSTLAFAKSLGRLANARPGWGQKSEGIWSKWEADNERINSGGGKKEEGELYRQWMDIGMTSDWMSPFLLQRFGPLTEHSAEGRRAYWKGLSLRRRQEGFQHGAQRGWLSPPANSWWMAKPAFSVDKSAFEGADGLYNCFQKETLSLRWLQTGSNRTPPADHIF